MDHHLGTFMVGHGIIPLYANIRSVLPAICFVTSSMVMVYDAPLDNEITSDFFASGRASFGVRLNAFFIAEAVVQK
mgnify:CR=1 FL=1